MGFIELPNDQPDFGLRSEQGGPPAAAPSGSGIDVFEAAFRQTNTFVSAMQYMRNSGHFAPQPDYNPVADLKGWKDPKYLLDHGEKFVGSQSPAETRSIAGQIDDEDTDKRLLAANGKTGVIATGVAGLFDPINFFPGGVGIDLARGGLTFTKAAVEMGKAGFLATTAQEALLHATQQTRTFEESALNVASGTLLTAMLGGGAVSLLTPAERAGLAEKVRADRGALNEHAGNPSTGEAPQTATGAQGEAIRPEAANANDLPGSAQAAAAGAAAADTRELKPVSAFGLEKLPFDPLSRTFKSTAIPAKRAMAEMADVPSLFEQNLRGESTTLQGGPPIEIQSRLGIDQDRIKLGDMIDQQYSEYRYGEQKTYPRSRSTLENWTGQAPEGKLSVEEFKHEVSIAAMNNDTHEIPQVQAVAQFWRKEKQSWGDRAEKAIEGFKRKEFDDGSSYFPHLFDKPKIEAQRPEFTNIVTSHLAADQATKAQAQGRIEALSKKIAGAETNIAYFTKQLSKSKEGDLLRAGFEDDLNKAIDTHLAARKQLEEEIGAWQGKSAAEAKSALKARAKAEEARAPEAKRLKSADKDVDAAAKRILESERDLTVPELREKAHEIVNHIIGSPAGRFNYDIAAGGPRVGYTGGGEALRGSLHARDFAIPTNMIRDFIETDIEHVNNHWMRTVVPDTLMAERFGDVEMTDVFRKIEDHYAQAIDKTKDQSQREKLASERKTVMRDVAAVRDRLRGVYGMDVQAFMPNAARVVAAVKNLNVPISMGVSALSSLPDAAGAIFHHGAISAFGDGYLPWARSLMGEQGFNLAGQELKAMGVANETFLASRHHEISDIMDSVRPQSRLERTLQWGASRFQMVSMLAQWTDWAKKVAGTVAMANILRTTEKLAGGAALSERELRLLGESNITPQLAERIHKAWSGPEGGSITDGVHLSNSSSWKDKSAREAFEGAIARAVNMSVVTPGQEKPLIMSNPLLNVLTQFQGYTAAAHQRILISGLQRRDSQVMQGLMFSLGLGMISYKINSMTGGAKASDKPADWVKEAISRGNILGWMEWGNALASKTSGGSVDIYRTLGAGKPLSRYASRSAMDQLLGPSAGKVENILKITSALGRADWNEGDTKALRRVIAGQNLFYVRRLFDKVEESANQSFGIPMKAKPQ
jgi:hypothetical protein